MQRKRQLLVKIHIEFTANARPQHVLPVLAREAQRVRPTELVQVVLAVTVHAVGARVSVRTLVLRLELKTHEINLDNANTKIAESGVNIENIDFSKYENMDINELQNSLTDIQAKIIRLGAINLAAPEEIASESKRKEELDIQYNDLTEALEKLNSFVLSVVSPA